MRYSINIAVLVLTILLATDAYAQSYSTNSTDGYNPDLKFDGQPRDSFYYMKDDGIFSDEEKDEEAMYIYQKCNGNFLRRQYFDCSCIAGQFRLERDSKYLIPQSSILNKVYSGRDSMCANTVNIAGNSYQKCVQYSSIYRPRISKKQNEDYCVCVANRFANNFSKEPALDLRYIENIETGAMLSCNRTL